MVYPTNEYEVTLSKTIYVEGRSKEEALRMAVLELKELLNNENVKFEGMHVNQLW